MKLDIDLHKLIEQFWNWVTSIPDWQSIQGWIAATLLITLTLFLCLWVFHKSLELVAKIVENWKSLGFDVIRSPEELGLRRRRQQFSKVLASDLATLAKAENWNDQFFTDLEAEVEAEGGYFATPVARLLNRRSYGLRKVPSLIDAIESSTEQCLLVTGDPGSGKSVALRHLAAQMAERASNSRRRNETIPLYLNLKELPPAPPGGPSADFIKEFVLENIRRGDADTAAYVRENWSIYRDRGVWFFLFDSFDEIPAVLHAPTGSPVIQQHANAIRQFIEGMSECRGILASREFKGPNVLPWNKFRILPLNVARQEELIQNSFLLPKQKEIASKHTIVNGTGLLNNPLFLTLLCRYVKEENKPPINDNELLTKHITRLANREPEYIENKYGLSPDQLIAGSIRLAAVFALDPSLSLAPTQDQLLHALLGESIPGGDLEGLLAALIDIKIGRCDVKEARAGDRRFAFAHRRYQETLFVQHLIENPSFLPPNELLTDMRWREYTVTLLQIGSPEIIGPLLIEAEHLLDAYSRDNTPIDVMPAYGTGLHYFCWDNCEAVWLLRLLHEGLWRRLEVVPSSLRTQISRYLSRPWDDGDSYDRLMVLAFGGLLPEDDLQEKISWAITIGTDRHWDAAFEKSFSLSRVPEEIANWYREQISERLLLADTQAEIVKLEAIIARSPVSIGADYIVRRMAKVGQLGRVLRQLSSSFTSQLSFLSSYGLRQKLFLDVLHSSTQAYAILFVATLPLLLTFFGIRKIPVNLLLAACLIGIGILAGFIVYRWIWCFAFRSVGEPLNAKSVTRVVRERLNRRFTKAVVSGLIVAPVMMGVIGGFFHICSTLLGYKADLELLYLVGPLMVIACIGLSVTVLEWRRDRKSAGRLKSLRKKFDNTSALILHASSWNEVAIWLNIDTESTVPTVAEGRSFLRLVESGFQRITDHCDQKLLWKDPIMTRGEYRSVTRLVLSRLSELEKEN